MNINRKFSEQIFTVFFNNKAVVLMIVMFLVSVLCTAGNAASEYNIASLMRQVSTYAIVAIGYTCILSSGGMDLSVAEMISLTGVIYAYAGNALPFLVAVLIGILVAVAAEFLNAFLIRFFKIPGFVTTLGTGFVFKSITYILTEGKAVTNLSSAVKWFGQGIVLGIPAPFILAILCTIIYWIIMNRTLLGRYILAVGGNEQAAMVSGIKVDQIRVLAHCVGGICIGLGSIALTGRVGSAGAEAGTGFTMDCIAAVVIGGTPMSGGKANVIGTLFGVALIIIISNMLNLLGVSSYYQWMSKGIIMILAIILDAYGETYFQKMRANATINA